MKIIYLFIYILAISCAAFAYGLVSFSTPSPAKGLPKTFKWTLGAFSAYIISFFLWFLCAQFYNPHTVNTFFFVIAHIAMYLTLSLTAYFSLTATTSLGRGKKVACVSIPAIAAGAACVLFSLNSLFADEKTSVFFDRYDDIASLSLFCVLYGLVCLILRARGRLHPGYAKAALLLTFFAILAASDLLFLWKTQSILFIPIAFIAGNLIVASRVNRKSLTPVIDVRQAPATDERLALAGVTERERAIIRGLLSGDSYARIAEQEFISVNTVKSHVKSAYRKLGVATRHQLTALLLAK